MLTNLLLKHISSLFLHKVEETNLHHFTYMQFSIFMYVMLELFIYICCVHMCHSWMQSTKYLFLFFAFTAAQCVDVCDKCMVPWLVRRHTLAQYLWLRPYTLAQCIWLQPYTLAKYLWLQHIGPIPLTSVF